MVKRVLILPIPAKSLFSSIIAHLNRHCMQLSEKIQFLEERVQNDISKMKKKADRNKRKAGLANTFSVVFSAAVTVFLGLQVEGVETIFKNIALVFGVLATGINSVNAFFNYRSLWVKQKVTLLHLYNLNNEMRFFRAGMEEKDTISAEKVGAFFQEYQQIWDASTEEWVKLRSEFNSQEEGRNEG